LEHLPRDAVAVAGALSIDVENAAARISSSNSTGTANPNGRL
jgi:hypothetical protein